MVSTRFILVALATSIAGTASAPIPLGLKADGPETNVGGVFDSNQHTATSNQNGASNHDRLNMADTNDYHPNAAPNTASLISSAMNAPSAVALQTLGSMQQSQDQANVAISKNKAHAAEHTIDALVGASNSSSSAANGFEKREIPPALIQGVLGEVGAAEGGSGNMINKVMGMVSGGGGSGGSVSGGSSPLGGITLGSTNTSVSNQASMKNQNSASNFNSADSGRDVTMKRQMDSS